MDSCSPKPGSSSGTMSSSAAPRRTASLFLQATGPARRAGPARARHVPAFRVCRPFGAGSTRSGFPGVRLRLTPGYRPRAPAGAGPVPEARQLVAPGEPKANPEKSGSDVGQPRRADREPCAFCCGTMPWPSSPSFGSLPGPGSRSRAAAGPPRRGGPGACCSKLPVPRGARDLPARGIYLGGQRSRSSNAFLSCSLVPLMTRRSPA